VTGDASTPCVTLLLRQSLTISFPSTPATAVGAAQSCVATSRLQQAQTLKHALQLVLPLCHELVTYAPNYLPLLHARFAAVSCSWGPLALCCVSPPKHPTPLLSADNNTGRLSPLTENRPPYTRALAHTHTCTQNLLARQPCALKGQYKRTTQKYDLRRFQLL
jgi:hypothetical protein